MSLTALLQLLEVCDDTIAMLPVQVLQTQTQAQLHVAPSVMIIQGYPEVPKTSRRVTRSQVEPHSPFTFVAQHTKCQHMFFKKHLGKRKGNSHVSVGGGGTDVYICCLHFGPLSLFVPHRYTKIPLAAKIVSLAVKNTHTHTHTHTHARTYTRARSGTRMERTARWANVNTHTLFAHTFCRKHFVNRGFNDNILVAVRGTLKSLDSLSSRHRSN